MNTVGAKFVQSKILWVNWGAKFKSKTSKLKGYIHHDWLIIFWKPCLQGRLQAVFIVLMFIAKEFFTNLKINKLLNLTDSILENNNTKPLKKFRYSYLYIGYYLCKESKLYCILFLHFVSYLCNFIFELKFFWKNKYWIEP